MANVHTPSPSTKFLQQSTVPKFLKVLSKMITEPGTSATFSRQDRGVERFIILIASDYLASDDFKILCLRVEANFILLVMINSGKHLQQSNSRTHHQGLTEEPVENAS
jgi:hypothetical protein